MHRDYSSYTEASYIQIRMFNDRIEIQSQGALYGGVTIESLGENKNETRNRNLEPPIFEEKRGDFWVVFKNHTLMTKEDIEWIKNLHMELSEDEAIAVTFIKKNGKITNGDYQKLNNINRDKALIYLKKLMNKGLISAQGVGIGTYYILNNNKRTEQINFLDEVPIEDKVMRLEITTGDKEIPPKIKEKRKLKKKS